MKRVILPNKLVGETLPLIFDFSSSLTSGDSLQGTPLVTYAVYSGQDPLATSMGANAPTRAGAVVTSNSVAGVPGVIYTVICTCSTTLGGTLALQGFLAVLPDLGQG